MLKDKSFLQKFVMPPSAATRMLWDMLGILCVCYDVFMIPFLGAFDVTLNTGMIAVSIAVAIFWSIDLMAMFLTGFHTSGLIEMRPSRIAKNYLQTWLMLDLVIVATDWFFHRNAASTKIHTSWRRQESSHVQVYPHGEVSEAAVRPPLL